MKIYSKKFSKTVAILMAFVLVLTLCPIAVFADAPVYEVGDGAGQYATVGDAFAQISTEGTIKLMKDVSGETLILINGGKKVTLDLNGHVCSFTGSGVSDNDQTMSAFYVSGNGTEFTLEDTSANADGYLTNTFGRAVKVENNAKFTMESGAIKDCNPGKAGQCQGSGVTIGWNGWFYMNGGTITNCASNWSHGIKCSGNMVITGGSVYGNSGAYNNEVGIAFFNSQSVAISGGSFSDKIESSIGNDKCTITGGSFDRSNIRYNNNDNGKQVSDYIPDGYSVNLVDGRYVVSSGSGSGGGEVDPPVNPPETAKEAKIGDTEYETLTAALAAAVAGDTVEILLTPAESSYSVNKAITLTLDAGVTATFSGSVSAIVNNGTLTANDMTVSGTVTNAGTLTINDGTFEGAVTNTGTLTITDGSFAEVGNTTAGEFNLASCIALPKIATLENGYWVIGYSNEPCAKIGDNVYFSLADAVAAASSGDTIQLIADCHEDDTVEIPIGKNNMVLDLNGYVLYGNSVSSVLKVNCTWGNPFTITDTSPASTHLDPSMPAGGVITGGAAQQGGGVFVQRGSLNLLGGTIYDCNATICGGGIYVSGSGSLAMSGGTISHCSVNATSWGGGGGIYYACASTPFQMSGGTIEYCTVTAGNSSGIGGGAIFFADGVSAVISGDSLIDNCVRYDTEFSMSYSQGCGGGGIITSKNCNVTINGGTISNCKVMAAPEASFPYCYGFGGGINLQGSNTTLTMNGGTIIGCTADREAGGVLVHNAQFIMNGGTITECICYTKGGGGLSYFGTASTTEIQLNGGRITNCSSLATDGTYLKSNEIAGGGAICGYDVPLQLSGDFTIMGNTVIYGDGGGILLGNPDAQLWVEDNPVVLGNTSKNVADNVYLNTGVTIKVTDALTDGCSIGITTKDVPSTGNDVSATAYYEDCNGANDSGDLYFVSDNPAYAIKNLSPVQAGNQFGEVVLTVDANYMKIIYHENDGDFTQNFKDTYNDPANNVNNINIGTTNFPKFEMNIAPSGEVTRNGFTFQSWNTAPDGSGVTYTANELTAKTVTIEGHGTIHLYAQWHRIVSYSISIGSNLKMNFYVQGIPESEAANYTMAFVKTGTESYLSKGITGVKSGNEYKFTLDKIYPQNMTDSITANLYDQNNTRVASINSKSIQTYCEDFQKKYENATGATADAVKALCADTLEYGAMAQKFQGETDATKLANNLSWVADSKSASTNMQSLTSDSRIFTPEIANLDSNVKFTGSGIILGNSLYVYFVITVSANNSGNYTLKDGKGNLIDAYDRLEENGRTKANLNVAGTYYVISSAISATGGSGNKIFRLYENGVEVQGVRDSVYSYVYRNQSSTETVGVNSNVTLGEMCSAVYNYCASAKAYYDLTHS